MDVLVGLQPDIFADDDDESDGESIFNDGIDFRSSTTARAIGACRWRKKPRKEQREELAAWLEELGLALANGEHADSLLTRDPLVVSKMLSLLKDTKLELLGVQADQALQAEAEAELRNVGIIGLFDLLSRAVLEGKFPLDHSVWIRLIDMLENMYAPRTGLTRSCSCHLESHCSVMRIRLRETPRFHDQTKLLASMGLLAGSGAGALRQMGRGAVGEGSLPNDPSLPGPGAVKRFLDANSQTGEEDLDGVGNSPPQNSPLDQNSK